MSRRQWRIRYTIGMVIGCGVGIVFLYGTGRLTSVRYAITLIVFVVLMLALVALLSLLVRWVMERLGVRARS